LYFRKRSRNADAPLEPTYINENSTTGSDAAYTCLNESPTTATDAAYSCLNANPTTGTDPQPVVYYNMV